MSKKIPLFETSKPYTPIGKYLLLEDSPEKGETHMAYHRDIATKAYVVPRRGTVPTNVIEDESFMVPRIEISTNPMAKRNVIGECSYDIKERARIRANDCVSRQEDAEIFKLISSIIPSDHEFTVYGDLYDEHMFVALGYIENHELDVAAIVMNPCRYHLFRYMSEFVKKVKGGANSKPYRAMFDDDIPIYVSTTCPKNSVLLLAEPKYVGTLITFEPIKETPHENAKEDKEGYIVSKTIGLSIVNDYACARIIVTGGTSYQQSKQTTTEITDAKNAELEMQNEPGPLSSTIQEATITLPAGRSRFFSKLWKQK